jgi:hypothetical protein
MALENIPTIGPGALNANLDKVVVYKNGGSEAAVSLLTLVNSALNPSGVYLDPINGRIGIGTPSPTGTLTVKGIGTTSSTTALNVQNGTGTTYFSITDDGTINSLAGRFNIKSIAGDHGGWFQTNATQSLQITNNIYNNGTAAAMNLNQGGLRIEEGVNNNAALARLHVIGKGSTSATTSLLVQNSSGIESLKVQDDNIVRTTYLGIGGGTSTNNIGGTHIAQFGNAVSSGDQLIVVDSVAGTKRGFKFGNQGTIRMALIQDGVNLQIGNFVSTFNPYVTFEYVTGNVGFGTASTNSSAKVQIDSTTQGFLKPRLTTAQKNAIVTPAAGLEVYDTDLNRPCFYNGTSWITL